VLVGVDTGYEGRFDFPPRQAAPTVAYMLASVPRTGSTFVSHLLWRTGCLGAPLEYLNFDPAGPYFFAAASPAQQLSLWRSVLRRRTSPNGVFGVKCFPTQLQALQESNPELLGSVLSTILESQGGPRAILLGRRDKVAHAISYARAILSGVWRREQEADREPEVDYSEVAVERALGLIEAQSAAWDDMFRDLKIEPLRLWYEDVLDSPERTQRQVADHLGVALDPAAAVDVPAVEPQSRADSQRWAELYAGPRKG
jgi:LPS sulfotransferase NodH